MRRVRLSHWAIWSLIHWAGIAPAAAEVRLSVEFTEAGECLVSGAGGGYRSTLKYPRRTAEMRCAVPAAPGAEPVVLEVRLPPGLARPSGEFPQLAWAERDGRWVGTARLPGPPAFVRVTGPSGRGAWLERVLDALVVVATAVAILWSLIRGRRS